MSTVVPKIPAISRPDEDTTIIGAGPYGLAVAAHLRERGLGVRVFGRPMSFWEGHMPSGMLLRSAWSASNISDPNRSLTLDAYEAAQPAPLPRPLPGADFARYGRWFQAQAVPDVDQRQVSSIERLASGFALTLEDGERVTSSRAIVATGLRRFARRPSQFDSLGDELAIHSVDATEPGRFAGRSVAVIGAGQSAVETAALVHEAGAEVELIARAPGVRWLVRGERLRAVAPLVQRLLYAPSDVGPAGVSWIVSLPELFRRLPVRPRERLAYRSIRPAATGWLVERTRGVKMSLGRRVVEARADGGRARLTLDDGATRTVDHVILATGYRIDATQEPAIAESTLEHLDVHAGYPVLGTGFESSVAGLHFCGAYAAWSFGPIMRFVWGTDFTARAVAERLARDRRGNPPPRWARPRKRVGDDGEPAPGGREQARGRASRAQ